MSFQEFLTKARLEKIYYDKIIRSSTVGVDRINNYEFRKKLDFNIKAIVRDISRGEYNLKPYKIILIPKEVSVKPRKVCVPTIRDRLIIEALKEYLYLCYKGCNLNYGISNLISNFIVDYNSKQFTKYIKADLSTYFDTINHRKLISKIRKNVKDDFALVLLKKILKNKQKYNGSDIENNVCGVPQGLSISMLLANIYMMDIDSAFNNKRKIKYYRYVDDVFILCQKNAHLQYTKLRLLLFNKKLKLNKKKTKISKIHNPFDFLGYHIKDNRITVKEKSVRKLENSLERLFKHYKKNKNVEELKWRLNIRISGAISNNKKYGWLFYFNKINDLKLLYHLDDLVSKFKVRYKVQFIECKKFVNTYYEIRKKDIKNNAYFFNVDKANKQQKKEILATITDFSMEEIEKLSSSELNYNYKIAIFKCLKSLEMDLDSIS